jgi:competence protein ComEC
MEILCFFSGVAFVYLKNGFTLGFVCLACLFTFRLRVLVWFCLGIVWALGHDAWISSRAMPNTDVIARAELQGVVVSIPVTTPDKTQFEFQLQSLNGAVAQARVLLSCYDACPNIYAGQRWQLQAKLKKPQNLGNPGGFDYVRSLKARHIHWVGYTRRGNFKYLGQSYALKQRLIELREYFSLRLNQQGFNQQSLAIINALTLGLGSKINQDTWGLFRRTGTTHLMVISGAHIGLVTGLTYGFIRRLWSRLGRLPLKIPAQRVASLVALLMALIYSVLAGFGVPAQRALIVCFFMLLRYMGGSPFTIWQAWRYALFSVLLFEPHSVMMPGFYLSFIAVGILISASQLITQRGILKVLGLQLSCLIGLMPLTLFLFSYGSANGFFANLLAIPWVGFLIIPLGLLTVFLGSCMSMVWVSGMLNQAISGLLFYLNWIDRFSGVNITLSFASLWLPLMAMLSLGLCFIFPMRRFGMIALMLMLSSMFPRHERTGWGEARVDVLDVAQGLSVVVQTAQHVLVYDTGVKFYRGGDMGELALIPYLKRLGVKALDTVVISHPDLDHRGGLLSLEKAYTIHQLLVDDPTFYHRGESCHNYPSWTWDGVSFRFFPMPLTTPKKNNHSCVLHISNAKGSMLLTGDIEQSAERYLVKQQGNALHASFLLAPHHGSKTSSSSIFLDHVSPISAIMSYGFDNRYHFPHAVVVARYEAQNIALYATEPCGMVRVFLPKEGELKQPTCSRYHK